MYVCTFDIRRTQPVRSTMLMAALSHGLAPQVAPQTGQAVPAAAHAAPPQAMSGQGFPTPQQFATRRPRRFVVEKIFTSWSQLEWVCQK